MSRIESLFAGSVLWKVKRIDVGSLQSPEAWSKKKDVSFA